MISFNDILVAEGVEPGRVKLVRHADTRTLGAATLHDVWREDRTKLEVYQSFQHRPVFVEGDVLASFVATPLPQRETLFIGLYEVIGEGRAAPGSTDPVSGTDVAGEFHYEIIRREALHDYVGRLTIEWGRGFRTWLQRAEGNPKPVRRIAEEVEKAFPGFDSFVWDIDQLDEMPMGWKEILQKVKGVYLLVDKEDGKQYVGSATGESLLSRFYDYYDTGHGGNVELKRRGPRRYQVTVLEIGSFDNQIRDSEKAWKKKLLSALNLN